MMRAGLEPDPSPAPENDEERKQGRLAGALLGFVALVQSVVMFSRGLNGLGTTAPYLAVVLPAALFGFGTWRGRLRGGTIAFAVLWSVLSVCLAVVVSDFVTAHFSTLLSETQARLLPWLIPVVAARAICFVAAIVVLVTGAPGRSRRRAGGALALAFAVLFLAEQAFQLAP